MAHDVTKYRTGGGVLQIKKLPSGTYEDIGNCVELTVETKIDKLEHFASRTGTKTKDKSVVQQKTVTLKFKLDEIAQDQLALYFQGIIDDEYTIRPLMADEAEYSIKFTPDYQTGEEWELEFWRVSISAAGALNLIKTGEWAELEFEGEVLADATGHPTNPWFGMTLPTV